MPTQKHRVNLSVPRDMDRTLHALAVRDRLSVSTKALDLLRRAIELEEDEMLRPIAESRDKKSVKFLSHDQAWA